MTFELQPFNRNVPDEALLADLVRAHAELDEAGKKLTFRAYAQFGKYHASTITARFGSWNDALRTAGVAPVDEKNVSADALFDNLRLVWIAKGAQPVCRDMRSPPSQYSSSTYAARFGGWRKALQEFVAAVADEQQDFAGGRAETRRGNVPADTARQPSLSLRFLVLRRDCFRCVACGRSPATEAGLALEVDHIIAWSSGGKTVPDNLQSLCWDCNRGKGAT